MVANLVGPYRTVSKDLLVSFNIKSYVSKDLLVSFNMYTNCRNCPLGYSDEVQLISIPTTVLFYFIDINIHNHITCVRFKGAYKNNPIYNQLPLFNCAARPRLNFLLVLRIVVAPPPNRLI